MRHAWGVAAALAITTALSATAQQEEKVEQGIRTLDAREAEAMLASNLAILDQLWSPAFVVNAPDNTLQSKDQVLNAVRESRIRYSAFDRTVERVVLSGDDLAISMGGEVVVPKGVRPDAGTQVIRRYSHVWKRTNGDWLLIARHANVVPAPSK